MSNEYHDLAYDPESSPSRATHGPHSLDDRLREGGWACISRPKRGEALWRRGNVTLAASDALARELEGGT